MIAIIDYGMGNLASVYKAVSFLGGRARVTSDPQQVARARSIIFPGVGAFGEAMKELKKRRLVDPIRKSILQGTPFLGLCLGLQLLFETSEESPGVKGLSVLSGRVRRLPLTKGLKIPHMGWNQIQRLNSKARLLQGVPEGAFMYFVHSFYADPRDKKVVVAAAEYGCRFPAVVSNGKNLWATQFHPEKSQKWGLKILNNYIKVAS